MFKVYHVVAALLLVALGAACTTLPAVDVQPTNKLHVDAYLLQPCEPLSNVVSNPTKTDTLYQHKDDGSKYAECSVKQAKLAEILKKQIEVEK